MAAPRIVIRTMINRRDSAVSLLLAGVLRKMGCKVRICSQRDFVRTLKYWKPHVAIGNARGVGRQVKQVAPQTKTVFWDGEGVNIPEYSAGATFAKFPDLLDSYDRFLLWGKWSYDDFFKVVPGADKSKVTIVGNPNLDLASFLPQRLRVGKKSNSIGVLTRFRLLNFHDGTSALTRLPNEFNLEAIKAQSDDFIALIRSIREILSKTDLEVVVRPHPLERVQTYEENKAFWFGEHASRVSVDSSLSIAEFAARQRALVTPTSTSFLQAYLLQVPVIDISVLGKTENYSLDGDLATQWLGAAMQPASLNDLVDLVQSRIDVKYNEKIEHQLEYYCDYSKGQSSILRAALAIMSLVKSTTETGFFIPEYIVELIDRIAVLRMKNKVHNHLNFYYKSGIHSAPQGYHEMLDEILNTMPHQKNST